MRSERYGRTAGRTLAMSSTDLPRSRGGRMQHLLSKQTSPSPATGLWSARRLALAPARRLEVGPPRVGCLLVLMLMLPDVVRERRRGAGARRRRRSGDARGAVLGGGLGCTRGGTRPRSERRFPSTGKRRHGVMSSLSWRESIGCELPAVSRLLRPARYGSRWPRRGRSAIARAATISRVRYERSRRTFASTWFRAWARRSWWASRVRTCNGSWAAGWPRGWARARSGRSSTPPECYGETSISSLAAITSCSSIRPVGCVSPLAPDDASGSPAPGKPAG
jgi:hypothetical protein